MRHWILAAINTGFIEFNDLSTEHQVKVFAHCSQSEKIAEVISMCEDDPYSNACWRPRFIMCLETWR